MDPTTAELTTAELTTANNGSDSVPVCGCHFYLDNVKFKLIVTHYILE